MSGHAVHPHSSTRFYSATKFAMTALVEGFRAEVADAGAHQVRVTSVSPRTVRTGFADNLSSPPDPEAAAKLFAATPHLLPEDVADAIEFILSALSRVCVHDMLLAPSGGIYQ